LNRKQAWKIVVSLSHPTKMPCFGYSISALKCITGSKLRKIKDSVCSDCYAFKGWYPKSHVQKIYVKRLKAIGKPRWIEAMIFLIKFHHQCYFRWHDSGDLQSVEHLDKICQVALGTPETIHWLPTREWGIVRKYVEQGNKIPKNLVIRLSATMFDEEPPIKLAKKLGVQASMVTNYRIKRIKEDMYPVCPAMTQGHKCLSCRKCWNKNEFIIIYPRH